MSGPVNVLAVMLADSLAAEDWRVLKTGDRNGASARKFSDEARAAVAELVEALQRIESFRCELAGISEADALEMQECAECARCRAKRWPPSHLCTAHYAVISRRDRLNESRESTQHIDMREIARAALARVQGGAA